MDYPLENLGPERFQLLCQSLITREYPRVQCLPVAQPDGGRDALSYLESDKFIVFQVKYARKPLAETDAHKWLASILEEELPKIRELITRGASQYILVTNIPGTAHLDGGSIDRMDRETHKLGLPSQCWWRDDLNRKLDNAWSLKWVYPELMTGPDFLRWIVESGLSEHRERRASSIRAFLRTQYDMDEEVRFKQVELQNKLLDLFIDVPTTFREPLASSRPLQIFYSRPWGPLAGEPESESQTDGAAQEWATESPHWAPEDENVFEASTLLLSEVLQNSVPRIVMEGAPGQGKSTIAQYVCQVHRMRLLQEEDILELVPPKHKEVPVRLPIKVDLRDLATWIAKKDPFNIDAQNESPKNWHKSLEGFLAALISHQSGGTQFSIDDFLAVSRISAILLVLDGLDEVADVQRRQETVEEIVRGVQRLEENAASLQVIVTSRPAAFANSPGMPHTKYTYLQLLSLTRPLIMQYAEKWLRARRLELSELPAELSLRAASILAPRADHVSTQLLYKKYMQAWDESGSIAAELAAEVALDLPRFATDSWDPDLQLLQRSYRLGQTSEPRAFYFPPVTRESKSIPIHIAKAILNESEKYPGFLVMLCDERCRLDVAAGVTAVAHVATRDGWFASL